MTKDEIIREIKKTATANGGKPLGQELFAKETGIKISDWHGRYWVRWSQALEEAGFEANKYNSGYSDHFILEKLALLTRDLGHFPVMAEIKIKSISDSDFPSHGVFDKLGVKNVRIQKLREFCLGNPEFNDILELIPDVVVSTIETESQNEKNEYRHGFVYLLRHGNRNEYKIGRTNNPIRREGELNIELPEKVKPVHWIETDDAPGIEKYWHDRFDNKRKNGEWFILSNSDVKAFKRWRKIY
jgi:hypothetical protein